MIGIGPFEILFALVVLLIVVGPERMPEVIRFCARLVRQVREAASEVREHVEGMAEAATLRDEVDAVRDAVHAADVTADLRLVTEEIQAATVPAPANPGPPAVPDAAEPADTQAPLHPE